ncbi:hypothetical protein JD969_02860 [Planctomycetota bacterium]|nr:hypothetical protein JD969_02860 [Planctomycetota bacterium]
MMADQEHMGQTTDDDLLAGAIPISAEDMVEEAEDDILTPIDVSEPLDIGKKEVTKPALIDGNVVGSSKIRTFQSDQLHKDEWTRETNSDGTGASHCKTFFAKLRQDAIHHLDDQINTWLDEHPEYEVKFSTSCVGKLVGKTNEDAVFMTVWV